MIDSHCGRILTPLPSSIIRTLLRTYLTGLIFMIASGLGALAALCLYLKVRTTGLNFVSIAYVITLLGSIIFVWYSSGSDDKVPALRFWRTGTLWALYLALCAHLILAAVRPSENSGNFETTLTCILVLMLVVLPRFHDFTTHFTRKMRESDAAGR